MLNYSSELRKLAEWSGSRSHAKPHTHRWREKTPYRSNGDAGAYIVAS